MIKTLVYIIGFLLATAVNYFVFTYVNYGQDLFGIIRVIGIGTSFLFFFQLIKNNNIINRASTYLEKHGHERKGNYFFAFVFALIHIVAVFELSELYNYKLLSESNFQVSALITSCKKSHCVCEYSIEQKTYEQKFDNHNYEYQVGDIIELTCYSNNSNIYEITDANKR